MFFCSRNKFNLNDRHSLAENMYRQFVLLSTWYIFLISADYSGFDDSVLFKLNWPGQDETQLVKWLVLFKFHLFHLNTTPIAFKIGTAPWAGINHGHNTQQRKIQMPDTENWDGRKPKGGSLHWSGSIGLGVDAILFGYLFVSHGKLLDIWGLSR